MVVTGAEGGRTISQEEQRALLSKKIKGFVAFAYAHSSAFRDRLDRHGISPEEIKGLEDLPKIPLLRKEEIRERQEVDPPFGGLSPRPPREAGRIYVNPGMVFQPLEGEEIVKGWTEALLGVGIKRGDVVQNTFNYHLWPFALTIDRALQALGATVVPMGVGNTTLQVRVMRDLRVDAFVGTPSFLMTLAERAEAMGLDPAKDFRLKVALVTGEMLPEGLRELLQKRWGAAVRQAYGTVFTGCLGYECHLTQGLHIPEGVIVEVVDPESGTPVPPGAAGEVVATSFDPSFPMIRFATGDLSILVEEPCPCGRPSPRLKGILGRVDQATKVKGTFIHPWQTDQIAAQFPEIFKYQVIISRKGYTDVLTFVAEVREEGVDKDRLKARLQQAIKEHLTIKGEVEIVPAGSIPDWHQKIVDRRQWE